MSALFASSSNSSTAAAKQAEQQQEEEAGQASAIDDEQLSYDSDASDDEEVLPPGCTYLDPAASCLASPSSSLSLQPTLGILSVSFSGCGAFYPYFYGIACYLQDVYDLRSVQFLGASGGCLPALTLATGLDVREAFFDKWNVKVLEAGKASKLKGYFSFIDICRAQAHAYFPEDIHERAAGRLHLSTSRVQLKPQGGWGFWNAVKALAGGVKLLRNERISSWSDKSDLIDCVAASTYIPILARGGPVFAYRDGYYMDGGLTDNQPVLDAETIRLQPFQWREANALTKASFIYIRLSMRWHAKMFQRGYDDAKLHARHFAAFPKRAQPETRPVLPPEIVDLLQREKARKNASTDTAAQVAPVTEDMLPAPHFADVASAVIMEQRAQAIERELESAFGDKVRLRV